MEYKGNQLWQDSPAAGDTFRKSYVQGIGDYIRRKNLECKDIRRAWISPEALEKNQESYRTAFGEMLGLKFFEKDSGKEATCLYAAEDEVCRIFRLTVWVTEEIPFYALLLIPHGAKEPMPLVIAQHGGGGTPELCSDFLGPNKYNHMVQRTLERGAAVLAPQIAVWSREETETMRRHPIPYDRLEMDIALKRFGSSLTALEISGIRKALDYVCTLPEIDGERIGMVGCSYGGYFTLNTMAADTRIKAGYCVAVFNDRDVYSLTGWCYKDSALLFQDAEVAALCAPRKLFVQVGKEDEVFGYETALPEAERVHDYFEAFGVPAHFRFHVWEGGHTLSDSDEGFDFLFSALREEKPL